MFLRKRGQSTAEYAIVIGLVIAIAAGITQVVLKRGIAKKTDQVVDYFVKMNDTELGGTAATDIPIYSQEYRKTDITAMSDVSTLKQGAGEEKTQSQTTTTNAYTAETIDTLK